MSSSIQVIDNFVSPLYENYIEEMFAGNQYKWNYLSGITYGAPDSQPFDGDDDNSGFYNIIYSSENNIRKSETDFLLPLLYEGVSKYKRGISLIKELYRIRAVMWIKNQNKGPHHPHCDLDFEHHTMVYYIHDTDSPTRMYRDGKVFKEVQPKKGRAVIFPGNTQHSSASPIKTSRRMIVNFNFLL